jgi:nucleoside-diphosphate-sugar epimerase
MKVLLTGATGFIGSDVLDRLVKRGDSVRVLALPETVPQLRHRDSVHLIVGGFTDRELLAKATRGVEVVYHLGGLRPGYPPRELMSVNVEGTRNLLQAAVRARVRRLVFSSSTSVYDESSRPYMRPIAEEFPLRSSSDGVIGDYAQSKIEAENLIRRFHRQHGLEYVILRAPVVYGSGARLDKQVLTEVITRPWLALTRKAQIADMQWVHVHDMATAVILAGTQPKAANQIFNIAGGELFSFGNLTKIVWRTINYRREAQAFPYQSRSVDNHGLKYDLSKAIDLLGYTPRVKLDTGVEELLTKLGFHES